MPQLSKPSHTHGVARQYSKNDASKWRLVSDSMVTTEHLAMPMTNRYDFGAMFRDAQKLWAPRVGTTSTRHAQTSCITHQQTSTMKAHADVIHKQLL